MAFNPFVSLPIQLTGPLLATLPEAAKLGEVTAILEKLSTDESLPLSKSVCAPCSMGREKGSILYNVIVERDIELHWMFMLNWRCYNL